MGKRIITQRRGRGSHTYKSPSHRFKGEIKLRAYDKTEKEGSMKGVVKDIVNCPGHSAPLALVRYENKETVLMAAPLGIKVNDTVESGIDAGVSGGNVLPLKNMPDGTLINNIEVRPGDGGKLVRSSGSFAKIVGKVGDQIVIRLP